MSRRPSPATRHRRVRAVLLLVWTLVVGASFYLFFFHRQAVQRELQNAMSVSLWAAGLIYLLLGCVRGFTLIPVTPLLALGVLFFPPVPLFGLTLIGIAASSASIYWFAEALHLEETFSRKHLALMEKLRALLRRREFPVIAAWSFLPIAPTDLICYICGVLRIDFRKCLFGVLLGEGAICALYVFLGHHFLRWSGLKG